MTKLKVGDKVEIVDHQDKNFVGKQGEINSIGDSIKSKTQPVMVSLPTTETEPRYDVVLEGGKFLYHLRDTQLRKVAPK